MEFYVLKIKGKDLFYNSSDEIGDFISSTPILLDGEDASYMLRCMGTYGDKFF